MLCQLLLQVNFIYVRRHACVFLSRIEVLLPSRICSVELKEFVLYVCYVMFLIVCNE